MLTRNAKIKYQGRMCNHVIKSKAKNDTNETYVNSWYECSGQAGAGKWKTIQQMRQEDIWAAKNVNISHS